MKIEFYRHNISEKDIANVNRVLRSVFLTTGKEVAKFEDNFSRFLGCKYTVGLTSCTAALHLSLLAFNIGVGDEVITTPLSFISTANSILYAGARPVFVDVEPETGNIDVSLIEKVITKKTKAIIPVHLYGQMCDMKRLRKIANKHNLIIIEDSAHCIEGKRDGIRPGQLGDAACFSFYATKNITCGEGGAITTNNSAIASKLKVLRSHGMSKSAGERYTGIYKHWDMELLGWKYNMSNIQATLLLNQLKLINKRLAEKEKLATEYLRAFKKMPQIKTPETLSGVKHARHLFTIWVKPQERDRLLRYLQRKGIGVAINFRAIHTLSYYRQRFGFRKGDFPLAEMIGNSTISIPLYPKLRKKEIGYIIKTVKNFYS